MSAQPFVIGLGEILWDVFCHEGGRQERRMGGAPANFAWHAAQHGLAACALSAVGQDAAGDELREALAAAGVPASLQRVPYATGEVAITLSGAGMPHYSIRPNAAWDHLEATPAWLDWARQARAVCFGTLAQRSSASRAAVATFLQAVPAASWRILDVNLRCGFYTRALIQESLERANALKLNEDEMEVLGRLLGFCGLPQLEQARGIMARYGLRLLILTCGECGSYVLGEGGQVLSWLATPRVEVADTVGAGDCFTASFFAALLHGLPVAAAHAAAVQAAAYVCTQPGAMPELPGRLRLGRMAEPAAEKLAEHAGTLNSNATSHL